MKIGYCRVSTEEQNPDLQLAALKAAGCEKIFCKTLNALKDAVAKFLNSMSSEEISSVCTAGYL